MEPFLHGITRLLHSATLRERKSSVKALGKLAGSRMHFLPKIIYCIQRNIEFYVEGPNDTLWEASVEALVSIASRAPSLAVPAIIEAFGGSSLQPHPESFLKAILRFV